MKIEIGYLSFLGYLSKRFYSFNLSQLITAHKRGSIFSIFLLLLKGLIFLLFGIYNQDYQTIAQVDLNLIILKKSDYLNKWQTDTYATQIQSIALVLNSIVALYLMCSYFRFIYFGYQFLRRIVDNQFPEQREINEDQEELLTLMIKQMSYKIFEIMSVYCSLYQFLLTTPIVYFSTIQYSHPIAPLNLILALLLGTIIIDSDYCYSLEDNDNLKRPYNRSNIIVFYLDFLAMIMVIETSFNIDCLFVGIYFLVSGWISSCFCPYYNHDIQIWSTFTYFYFGMLSITFSFSIQKLTPNNVSSLMTLIYIPIIFILSMYYCRWQNSKDYKMFVQVFNEKVNVNLSSIDRMIRLPLFQQLQNYRVTDEHKIDIYNLIIQKERQFFLDTEVYNESHKYLELSQLFKDIANGLPFEPCLLKFLNEQFLKISQKKKEQSDKIVYFVYLLEIVKNLRSYWLRYENIKRNNYSLKQEQILIGIHLNFLKQKDVLTKSQDYLNTFDTHYQSVLDFEQRIEKVSEMLAHGIQIKLKLLQEMKHKEIDAQSLMQHLNSFIKSQKRIKQELEQLSQINNNNSDLKSLQLCYLETISFLQNDFNPYNLSQGQEIPQKFKTKQIRIKQNQFEGQQDNNLSFDFDFETLFSKHSCCLFTKIEDTMSLTISKVSSSFTDLFSYDLKEVIGKPIDFIMPSNKPLILKHRLYVSNYLKKQENQNSNINSKIIFGLSSQGFVIPLKMDIRVNFSHQLQDVGLCVQALKIQDDNDYIVFDSITQNVIGMTEFLKQKVFDQYNFKIKVYKITQLFPFLTINEGNAQLQKLKEYMLPLQNIQKKQNKQIGISDNGELTMYDFFFMEVTLSNLNYQGLSSLYFLKFSKIKKVDPYLQKATITKYFNDYYSCYNKIIPESTIDNIKSLLEYNLDREERVNPLIIKKQQSSPSSPKKHQRLNMKEVLEQSTDQQDQQATLSETDLNIFTENQKRNNSESAKRYSLNEEDIFERKHVSEESDVQQNVIQEPINSQLDNHLKMIPDILTSPNDTIFSPTSLLQDKYQINSQRRLLTQRDNITYSQQISVQNPVQFNQGENNHSLHKQGNNNDKKHSSNEMNLHLSKINKKNKIFKNEISQQQQFQQKFYDDQIINDDQQQFNGEQNSKYNKSLNNIKLQQEVKPKQNRTYQTFSKKSNSSMKQGLLNILQQSVKVFSIQLVNIIGSLAFLILLCVSLYHYFYLMNLLHQISTNQEIQSWPYDVQIIVNRATKNLNLLQIEQKNNFTFPSTKDQKDFDEFFSKQLAYSAYEFNQQIQFMERSNSDLILFKKLREYPTQFLLNIEFPQSNLSGISNQKQGYYMEQRNASLMYSIVFMNHYFYYQSVNKKVKLSEFMVLSNIPHIIQDMKEISSQMSSYYKDQQQLIEGQITMFIVVILFVSAICLITVFPLYAYLQKQKDSILYLFCTFPQSQLEKMTEDINISCIQLLQKFKPDQKKDINLQISAQNIKKQTISQINKLPRFKISLFTLIVLSYGILLIYPITDKLLIENFLNNTMNNMLMIDSLNIVESFVVESAAMSVFGLEMVLYPNNKTVKLQQYISQIDSLISSSSQIMSVLTNVQNQFVFPNRYNSKEYKSFFFPLFDGNICNKMSDNSRYIVNQTLFDISKCNSIQNGFLQKGLKVSIEKYTNIIQDLNQMFKITNKNQLESIQKQLFQNFDLNDYSFYVDYLDITIRIMKQFLQNNCLDYFQYLSDLKTATIVLQIIIICIIFSLGWYVFMKYLIREMVLTKQYLQAIDINNLLDNKYIQTFIQNNIKI